MFVRNGIRERQLDLARRGGRRQHHSQIYAPHPWAELKQCLSAASRRISRRAVAVLFDANIAPPYISSIHLSARNGVWERHPVPRIGTMAGNTAALPHVAVAAFSGNRVITVVSQVAKPAYWPLLDEFRERRVETRRT